MLEAGLFDLSEETVASIFIKLDNKHLSLFAAASSRNAALIESVNCYGKDILRDMFRKDDLMTHADVLDDTLSRFEFVGIDFLRFKGAETHIE